MALGASEESESMLRYHAGDYAKIVKGKSIEEDAENNNDSNNNEKNENLESEEKNGILDDTSVSAKYTSNWKGVLAQCLVTGAVLLLTAGGGMPIGYSAILLPQLAEVNDTMRVDRELGSWIASVHSLATPFGSLLSGPLIDAIGRRGALQLSAIPLLIGWIVMGLARSIPYILIGRVVSGFAVGIMAVPSQILLSEMVDPGLRGCLIGCSFAAYCFGILLVYVFGASFRWDIVAFCGTVLPVLAFIGLVLVPESPAWLVRSKRLVKAKNALLWLRGGDENQANAEIAILEARMKVDMARKSLTMSMKQRISSSISTIFDRGVMKPLVIINVFNALQMLSGTYVIVFYAVDLVKDIGGDKMNNYLAAVITAIIRFLFSTLSCVLLLKLGIRWLGMLSAVGTSLASLVLAGYMLTRREESFVDHYVLGICLLVYVGANTVGLLTLPVLMAGELLPQRARGIASGFNFFLFNLMLFAITKSFPMVNKTIGITGVFTIFGVFALLETIFIYLALPETKNRTLQEIEDYFQQDNMLWITRTKKRKEEGTLMSETA